MCYTKCEVIHMVHAITLNLYIKNVVPKHHEIGGCLQTT
jgi:hypothetical protein